MLKRTFSTIALALPLVIGIAACGGSDGNGSDAPPAVVSDNDPANTVIPSGDGNPTGSNADVESFCTQVDEFVAASKKMLADPVSADVEAITQQGLDLSAATAQLVTSASGDDAARLQECAAKFNEIGN